MSIIMLTIIFSSMCSLYTGFLFGGTAWMLWNVILDSLISVVAIPFTYIFFAAYIISFIIICPKIKRIIE